MLIKFIKGFRDFEKKLARLQGEGENGVGILG
jgi:hypothetical protein